MSVIPFSTRRLLVIALGILFATLAGVAGLGALQNRGNASTAGQAASDNTLVTAAATSAPSVLEFVPTDIYTVKPATLTRTLPITGTLTALTAATLKAKVAGELLEVTVREGQSVRQGQTLARIDQTDVLARVAARTADAEVARAQLRLAEKTQAMQKALLDKNFISQSAFDTAHSGYDVAAARLRATEADLVSARKALGDSVLMAPFAGIVSERHAQPGERVPLDARIISMVDLSRLTLESSVPAATIAQIKVGLPIAFRVDGFGERRFEGKIERINPSTATGSRSISIYALIENRDGLLRGGLFAQGDLILEIIKDVLVAPASAVREEKGQSFVYAISEEILHRRPVEIGMTDATGRVELRSGAAAEDLIVMNNLGQLREGSQVRVRGKTPASAAATNK